MFCFRQRHLVVRIFKDLHLHPTALAHAKHLCGFLEAIVAACRVEAVEVVNLLAMASNLIVSSY